MSDGSNAGLGLLGFWMLLQLAAFIVFLLGGIYVLYCLGRAASGLDRLASAVEDLVRRQYSDENGAQHGLLPPGGPARPGPLPSATPRPPASPLPNPAPPIAQPFVPGAIQTPPIPPAPPVTPPPAVGQPPETPPATGPSPAMGASPATGAPPATDPAPDNGDNGGILTDR